MKTENLVKVADMEAKKKIAELLEALADLNEEDCIELLEQIIPLMKTCKQRANCKNSLLALRGAGKDLWQKLDVAQYLSEQRDSWK